MNGRVFDILQRTIIAAFSRKRHLTGKKGSEFCY